MEEAVIVAGARTPIARAYKGAFKDLRPEDLMALTIKESLQRSGLDQAIIDDVIIGCATPEKAQGMNLGRIAALRAGLPNTVPGMTINRFCSSGLQSIALAAERIMCGGADAILAGGVESMSLLNMLTDRMYPNPSLSDSAPDTYMSMGMTAENVARKYGITREEADQFALESHSKACAAQSNNLFADEIVSVESQVNYFDKKTGEVSSKKIHLSKDEGPRADTNLPKLASLRPAFSPRGISTAGNSSQVSDGAACVLVTSKRFALEHNLEILATYKGFQVSGVAPELMGIGPVAAIPNLLKRTGLKLEDMKTIELNEAFAVQSLAVMKELNLNSDIVNPNGGAIALGHPLGCTGAKLTLTALQQAKRLGGGYAMVSMCIGGGMGAAGIFEV